MKITNNGLYHWHIMQYGYILFSRNGSQTFLWDYMWGQISSEDSDLADKDEVEPRVLKALNSDFKEPPKQDNVTDIVILKTDDSKSLDDDLPLLIV